MSQSPTQLSRRELLRRAGALSVAGPAMSGLGLSLAAMGQASAANATGYKALVCIFLFGGNDAYNTVLATDSASWSAYAAARDASSPGGIALAAPGTPGVSNSSLIHQRLGGVLPISPINSQSRTFAVHPVLTGVRDLFAARRLAVVSNVGPLSAPTSKSAYLAGAARPPKLFSHNDQQSFWQAFHTEGANNGWGGRMADLLMANNTRSMFTAMSLSGNAVWLNGQTARSFQMAPGGSIRIGTSDGLLFGSSVAQQKMRALMRTTRDNQLLQREHAAVVGRSIDADDVLSSALPAVNAGPWGSVADSTADPLLQYVDPATGIKGSNPLAQQLQGVARTIAARSTLGMARQVFFVSLSGFDTHDVQNEHHATALAKLSHGMAYFDKVLTQMGLDKSVTTFTASEFGRSLSSNGDGCDHGWGGHHFVMGGAVKGGDIYGRFPVYGTSDGAGSFTSEDQLTGGALRPTQGTANYAATLGKWFGLSDSELLGIMPDLGTWSLSARNLGFMA